MSGTADTGPDLGALGLARAGCDAPEVHDLAILTARAISRVGGPAALTGRAREAGLRELDALLAAAVALGVAEARVGGDPAQVEAALGAAWRAWRVVCILEDREPW